MRIVGKGKNEDSNFVLFIIISFEKDNVRILELFG